LGDGLANQKCPLTEHRGNSTLRLLFQHEHHRSQATDPYAARNSFTQPQLMSRYITDTGKILPRKYTHLSAKEQRNVTSKIKSARNLLTML